MEEIGYSGRHQMVGWIVQSVEFKLSPTFANELSRAPTGDNIMRLSNE